MLFLILKKVLIYLNISGKTSFVLKPKVISPVVSNPNNVGTGTVSAFNLAPTVGVPPGFKIYSAWPFILLFVLAVVKILKIVFDFGIN